MPYTIDRVDVWAGSIPDRPGGLAKALDCLREAGANLEFVIARRAPDKPGTGVVFLAPIKGAAQIRAAQAAGLGKTASLHSLRLEGPDKAGMGAIITGALADAAINLRGLSAASMGRKAVVYFAFDSAADAASARRVLKKTLSAK
ncbi:MAG TPA: amino acid-binding protein [Sumerlaeia bacterium]|nr:amino acid-binding protein [Sumerlaeia bacterium]